MATIAGWATPMKPAFLFVNNRLEGNAPSTIEAVASMLVASYRLSGEKTLGNKEIASPNSTDHDGFGRFFAVVRRSH
jgi:hypothetical protein